MGVSVRNSDYTPFRPERNGVTTSGELGALCVQTSTSADLRYALLDQKTGNPVTVPYLYLTLYDLDQHQTTTETVTFIDAIATHEYPGTDLVGRSANATHTTYFSLKE